MSKAALGLTDRERNSDRAASLAGPPPDKMGPAPAEPTDRNDGDTFPDVPGIERALERDPAFRPSAVRMAEHTSTGLLAVQIASFRDAGFLPNAISRLVKLCPADIETHFPNPKQKRRHDTAKRIAIKDTEPAAIPRRKAGDAGQRGNQPKPPPIAAPGGNVKRGRPPGTRTARIPGDKGSRWTGVSA